MIWNTQNKLCISLHAWCDLKSQVFLLLLLLCNAGKGGQLKSVSRLAHVSASMSMSNQRTGTRMATQRPGLLSTIPDIPESHVASRAQSRAQSRARSRVTEGKGAAALAHYDTESHAVATLEDIGLSLTSAPWSMSTQALTTIMCSCTCTQVECMS